MVEIAPGPRLLAVSALRVISGTWVNINLSSLTGLLMRVVGALLVFSSGVGVKFAQSSSQWEARADT